MCACACVCVCVFTNASITTVFKVCYKTYICGTPVSKLKGNTINIQLAPNSSYSIKMIAMAVVSIVHHNYRKGYFKDRSKCGYMKI